MGQQYYRVCYIGLSLRLLVAEFTYLYRSFFILVPPLTPAQLHGLTSSALVLHFILYVEDVASASIDLDVLDLACAGDDLHAIHDVAIVIVEFDFEDRPGYLRQGGGGRLGHVNPCQAGQLSCLITLRLLAVTLAGVILHADARGVGRRLGRLPASGIARPEECYAQGNSPQRYANRTLHMHGCSSCQQ